MPCNHYQTIIRTRTHCCPPQITVTLSNQDPLFQQKRTVLQQHGLATMQTFDLKRGQQPLAPMLIPYMRLAYTNDASMLSSIQFVKGASGPDPNLDRIVSCQLISFFNQQLNAYKHSLEKDLEVIEDPKSTPREKIAARLTKIEKSIWQSCIEEVEAKLGLCPDSVPFTSLNFTVKLS